MDEQANTPVDSGEGAAQPSSNGKKVVIYSTPSCQYCKAAKEFFEKNNITFTEHDVSQDAEKRQEMIDKSGQMGVPVIVVGEEMLVGFNEDKLSKILGL